MSENNIEILHEGEFLHCDNEKCGYNLTFEGEFRKELIGTKCPKCGENMLTEEDYEGALLIKETMVELPDIMNNLSKEQLEQLYELGLKEFPQLKDLNPEDLVKSSIHFHNGKINLNIEKNENTRI